MLPAAWLSHSSPSPIRPVRGRPASAHRMPLLRRAVAAVGFCFILVCAASAAETTQPRNVLILLTSEYGLPAYDVIIDEIRTSLKDGISGPLSLYAEYLDMTRFPADRHEQEMIDIFNRKYGGMKIDLLIAIGPSLVSVLPRINDQLQVPPPTVAIDLVKPGVALPTVLRNSNVTGVFPYMGIQETIGVIRTLHPGIEHLFVVTSATSRSQALLSQVRSVFRRHEHTLAVRYLDRMPMEALLRAVGELPDHSAVLVTSYQRDSAGNAFYTREATKMVAGRSRAPVYVLFDTNAGVGGLGGYVISFKKVGIEAAHIALRILQGEKPETIPPVRDGLHQYRFDWRQLQRWGISEDRLPEGSLLLHREVTFLEKHFWLVMGIMTFITLQAGLIAYLVILNRRQKTMSARVREAEGRYRELLRIERSARLGEMAGSLAHELNQPLTAILSSAQAGLRFLKSDRMEPDLLREILTHIVDDDKRAASVVSGMRNMLKRETPDFERLDVNGTVAEAAVIFHGESVARGIRLETDLDRVMPSIMASKNQLLQVFLNLLLNAAQAMASNRGDDRRAVLTTRVIGPNVVVSVRDNGTGIAPDRIDHLFEPFYTTKAKGMGMGLAVCRSIVEDHGGRIRAENNPDRGAVFTIELPAVSDG